MTHLEIPESHFNRFGNDGVVRDDVGHNLAVDPWFYFVAARATSYLGSFLMVPLLHEPKTTLVFGSRSHARRGAHGGTSTRAGALPQEMLSNVMSFMPRPLTSRVDTLYERGLRGSICGKIPELLT